MNRLFSYLLRRRHRTDDRSYRRVERDYVSEHTKFMSRFLEQHPEVVEDQWVGREIYWDKHIDFAEQAKARSDNVPNDLYGFRNLLRGRRSR